LASPRRWSRYVFLTTAVGDGYGGLEHRASTALLCSRADLPHVGMDEATDGYRQFLGLCSHEYFHTWNVKRIKPAAFVPYRLAEENYTRLLWAFEGFTSYYDDLMLVRSQRIGLDDYLKLLAKTITQVHKGSGRHKQSVAESSFEAWTKYYRQDENSPNAIVSYYTKGALVALLLDLRLRAESHGARSLDTLMQALWQRHGQTGIGVAEDGIFALAAELGGEALAGWLQELVEGTAELPSSRRCAVWASTGLGAGQSGARHRRADGGGRRDAEDRQRLRRRRGPGGGAVGGDVLVAIDGLKATAGSFDKLLARRLAGDSAEIHVFRRDELMRFEVELRAPLADTAKLAVDPDAGANAIALREAWLA
jgi:predicted metalloprotease with PDZ domain